jgi:hypothetical protein
MTGAKVALSWGMEHLPGYALRYIPLDHGG